MTTWTPQLEKDIAQYSKAYDVMMREALSPARGTQMAALRTIFYAMVRVQPSFERICKQLGVDSKIDQDKTIEKIIALADENKSNAADLLKKSYPVAQAIHSKVQKSPKKSFLGGLKIARSLGLKYPPA